MAQTFERYFFKHELKEGVLSITCAETPTGPLSISTKFIDARNHHEYIGAPALAPPFIEPEVFSESPPDAVKVEPGYAIFHYETDDGRDVYTFDLVAVSSYLEVSRADTTPESPPKSPLAAPATGTEAKATIAGTVETMTQAELGDINERVAILEAALVHTDARFATMRVELNHAKVRIARLDAAAKSSRHGVADGGDA